MAQHDSQPGTVASARSTCGSDTLWPPVTAMSPARPASTMAPSTIEARSSTLEKPSAAVIRSALVADR